MAATMLSHPDHHQLPASKIGTLVLIVLSLLICKLLYTFFTCPTKHIPGPWYTRFTHLRLKYAVITGQRIFYIDNLHKQYGPIVRLSPSEVGIADLASFKEIHKIGSKFLKSTWYQRLANFPKAGLFTMIDPRQHGPRRKLMAGSFARSYLVKNWESIVREKARMAVEKIREEAEGGKADVFNWWMLLASDVSAHLAFGESFGMLESGRPNQFIRCLKKLTMGAGIMAELPLLRLLRFIPIQTIQELFNGNEYIFRGADRAVQLARSATSSTNIFAKVIEDCQKDGENHIDDMDVRIEAMNIIIAGTDTTGVTLTYLTWAMLSHPQYQSILEHEVAQLPDDFTENDLMELPMLNAVIEETLRLYGAAPSSLPRVVPPGGVTLGSHYVPAGTTVCTQAYTFHRDPAIWQRPLKFYPPRWFRTANEDDMSSGTPPAQSPDAKLAFHPFGAGARSCVGIHLARMELRYAVAFFFRECKRMRLCESVTEESMEFENFFLIAPKGHRCEVTLMKGSE
ncbi:cytochrome P450 monooxygenase-like protein [Clohesyomyces aquaticus]|uniref:Cytochrome P450 monooxygenase-like protein n=1 Tax=Clohesyomyces aquaticus TaxID=1231657 RepID=A0A1Y1ZWD9_9PLEO|nr:cytochrome P450 monooxygenase-like protein [Clohesyomyces aquaticus]